MVSFHNHLLPTGAYEIDPTKDNYCFQLLNDYNINYKIRTGNLIYDYVKPIDILAVIDLMKSQLTPENCHLNTKTFMTNLFGAQAYNDFVIATSYRDFELECVTDTITHYGMDRNISGNSIIAVSWNTLWAEVAKDMKIEYGTIVQSIILDHNRYGVVAFDKVYYGKKIIVATDMCTVKYLFPMVTIYNEIHMQPFIRMYGVFNSKGTTILKKYITGRTLVSSPLQTITPIDQGLYMIAYADNTNAEVLSHYLIDNIDNTHILENIITKSLSCPDLKGTLIKLTGYYTYPGTHYYICNSQSVGQNVLEDSYENRKKFLHTAQRPFPNIWVVGEAVSLRQGWVEGALLSVEAVISDILLG